MDPFSSYRVADRMAHIGTESAFEVAARARALEAVGRDIVHLEIGEPNAPTAPHVVAAAVEALHAGETHYGPTLGLPETRAAVASYVRDTRGVNADPERVVIAPGAKPLLLYAMLALVQAGDEVIVPDPSFPIYSSLVEFVGGTTVPLPLYEARGFRFDPDELRRLVSPRTRLVLLNSPHNPTGGRLRRADLEVVADLARERNLVVLSDEIYSRILYEGTAHSIAAFPDMLERTILVDGWSKAWAMTGWRLGFGIFPAYLMPSLERLVVNSVSCTPAFVQRAGIAALKGSQASVEAMVADLRQRRDLIVRGLNELPGIRCAEPEGAFYAFPNIEGTGLSSRELADRLLYDGGVACLAGSSFGAAGEGYLRLSYATTTDALEQALERMYRVLAQATA